MMNHQEKPGRVRDDRHNDDQHDLDRMLDAALAIYAASEPRAGLEDRVLANLRAEEMQIANRTWWRWGLVAAVAAIVIMVVGWMLRREKYSQPLVKNLPSVPALHNPAMTIPATQTTKRSTDAVSQARHQPPRGNTPQPAQPEATATAYPKLDQFPSPQPLSEQEELLARYIAQDPEHATLVAEVRMQLLRNVQEEERQIASDDGGKAPTQDRKSQ